METTVEDINKPISESKRFAFNLYELIYFFLYILYFVLNFLGSPLLRHVNGIILAVLVLTVLLFDWKKAILFIIPYAFIEGQGRILWGYNPIFRISFDLILGLAILKNFIVHKKVVDKEKIPKVIWVLILLHFIWFIVSLFNPLGAGIFPSFATSKFYIFPFLVFFSFTLEPFVTNGKDLKLLSKIVNGLLLLTLILVVYQAGQGEELMYKISPNYKNLFPQIFSRFSGENYRAWGTSFGPGGPSVIIFLSCGFFFLTKKPNVLYAIFTAFLVAFSWFDLFLLQVRSAWMKQIAITGLGTISYLLATKNKFSNFVKVFLVITVTSVLVIQNFDKLPVPKDFIDFESSADRIIELTEGDALFKQRKGYDQVFGLLERRFYIMGNGLGMSTGFLPDYEAKRRSLIRPEGYFWNLDNFFYFALFELGIGAVFYLGIIILVPIFLFLFTILAYRNKAYDHSRVIGVSFVSCLVFLLGNWGAVGVPYNPESFFFWFWASLGFSNFYNFRKVQG